MKTATTVHPLNETTLEVHAPDAWVEVPSPGMSTLLLDPGHRVLLGWIQPTEDPAHFHLTIDPQDPITLALYDPACEFLSVEGISYTAPESATAEQIAAELNARIPAALAWARA